MTTEKNKEIVAYFISSINNEEWDKIRVMITIHSSGSLGLIFRYYNNLGKEFTKVLKTYEWGKKVNYIYELFKEQKENIETRFNRVVFEINYGNTYQVNYYWDEKEDLNQKQKTVEVFPLWLNDSIHQLLFEKGYGGINNWQKGTIIIKIQSNDVNNKVILNNNDNLFDAKIKLPDWLKKAILLHHETTNNGVLASKYSKWNTLIIQTNQASIDLEKDIEYSLEN